MSQAVAEIPKERMEVSYNSAGQEVTLNATIVKRHLAKGNKEVTDTDVVQFISLCKYNELNPFLNEAYLVKFGESPAQMVVSKEAFMKRADASPSYEGYRAGIIVKRGNEVVYEEGCFQLPEDILLGGWCDVLRSDRKQPIISRVSLSEYDTGQSLWKGKKATMIRKVAIVQSHREAFPSQLGAMYISEEQNIQDVGYEEIKDNVRREIASNANKTNMTIVPPESKEKPDPVASFEGKKSENQVVSKEKEPQKGRAMSKTEHDAQVVSNNEQKESEPPFGFD